MKRKYKIIAMSAFVIFLALFYYKNADIKYYYMKTFSLTGTIQPKNIYGDIDGETIFLVKGKLFEKVSYSGGLKNGWAFEYYSDGNIKKKVFYKNDKQEGYETDYYKDGRLMTKYPFKDGKANGARVVYYPNGKVKNRDSSENDKLEGKEYEYYENGNLTYIRNWRHNLPYGELYYYYNTGNLKSYKVFDVLGRLFYARRFDIKGNVEHDEGNVFSETLYTTNVNSDSTVIIKDKRTYSSINDLYITVATPPGFHAGLNISINNQILNVPNVQHGTVKLHNVFSKPGIYKFEIIGALLDKKNHIFKNHGIEGTIIKQQ